MQKRQVDLKLSVGVTLPPLPDLLQNCCQYITANITATGPASVPDEHFGNRVEYLHVKEACAITSLPSVGPETYATVNAQVKKFVEVGFQPRSHTVSCRPQVFVLQGQVLFERTIAPFLTFPSLLRMLLQNAFLKALCAQKPIALVTGGVRMSHPLTCLSLAERRCPPGLPWLLAGDSLIPQLCSWPRP